MNPDDFRKLNAQAALAAAGQHDTRIPYPAARTGHFGARTTFWQQVKTTYALLRWEVTGQRPDNKTMEAMARRYGPPADARVASRRGPELDEMRIQQSALRRGVRPDHFQEFRAFYIDLWATTISDSTGSAAFDTALNTRYPIPKEAG